MGNKLYSISLSKEEYRLLQTVIKEALAPEGPDIVREDDLDTLSGMAIKVGINPNTAEEFAWEKAKDGAEAILEWAKEQHDIDGDYAQVQEIISDWFGDLK